MINPGDLVGPSNVGQRQESTRTNERVFLLLRTGFTANCLVGVDPVRDHPDLRRPRRGPAAHTQVVSSG